MSHCIVFIFISDESECPVYLNEINCLTQQRSNCLLKNKKIYENNNKIKTRTDETSFTVFFFLSIITKIFI